MCLTLYDPMDCSLPGSSVNGILQARILVSVAFPYFRGSSQPRDQTQVSHCRWILYQLSHRETLSSLYHTANSHWLSLFPYGNVLSLYIPPSPSSPLPMTTSLFSVSASPLLPCKDVHQYHLSRFHIYALIYDICFSFSDLLHSV